MTSAEPVVHCVLKIGFDDGYEGVVDLRPVFARGPVFDFLADPERFKQVRLEEYGHHVYWIDDDGEEVELGADSLRRRAEEQAALILRAS